MQVLCNSCRIWYHDECLIKGLVDDEIPDGQWSRVPDEVGETGENPEFMPRKFLMKPPMDREWTVEIKDGGVFASEDRFAHRRWEKQIRCLQVGCQAEID